MSSLRHWRVGTLLSLFLVPALAQSATAQVFVGGGKLPQVEVDNSVLDRLGAAPTLPELLMGSQPSPVTPPLADLPAKHRGQPAVPRLVLKKPPHHSLTLHPLTLHPPPHHQMAHRRVDEQKTTVATAKHKAPATASLAVAMTAPTEAKPEIAKPEEPARTVETETPSLTPSPAAAKEPTPAAANDTAREAKAEAKADAAPEAKPAAASAPPAAETAGMPQPLTPPAAPPPMTVPPVTVPSLAPPAAQGQQEARVSPSAPSNAPAAGAPAVPGGGIEAPIAILFEKDGARLPSDARTALVQLAERMASDPNLQLQILAYAEGSEDNSGRARRLSLSRALAVRSMLIDQGVRSTRIEVRALGNKVPEGPADRVDVLVQRR